MSPKAPPPIGPYSQAVIAGDFVFVSGQIPLDPISGDVVGGSMSAQTKTIFANIAAILSAAECSLNEIVKVTVYLTDLNDFSEVNKVFAELFDTEPPARETVQVVALPKGVNIELSVVAVRRATTRDGEG